MSWISSTPRKIFRQPRLSSVKRRNYFTNLVLFWSHKEPLWYSHFVSILLELMLGRWDKNSRLKCFTMNKYILCTYSAWFTLHCFVSRFSQLFVIFHDLTFPRQNSFSLWFFLSSSIISFEFHGFFHVLTGFTLDGNNWNISISPKNSVTTSTLFCSCGNNS